MLTLHDTVELPTVQLPRVNRAKGGRSWRVAAYNGFAAAAVSLTLHLWVLMALAPAGSDGLWSRLMSWDAQLYQQVAQNGYPQHLTYSPKTHALLGDNFAFSPLYPLLERAVHAVIGSWTGAAMTVSWLSMAVCLTLLYQLTADLYGRSAALPAVILVGCTQPLALVFAMGYPDGGLYLSLGLGAVLCARARYWLWAGTLASLAGLTRPTGVAITATVGVMALAAWRSSDKNEQHLSLAGTMLGCFGTPCYLLWVGLRTGHMGAWFAIQQAGWGTHWDNGLSFWQFLTTAAVHADGVDPMVDLVTVVGVFAYAAFSLHSARRSELGVLAVWPLAVVVLTVGQSNYTCVKLRLLLAASVCLLPLAKQVAGWSAATRWTFLVVGTLLSCWWGYAMLNVWHWAL